MNRVIRIIAITIAYAFLAVAIVIISMPKLVVFSFQLFDIELNKNDLPIKYIVGIFVRLFGFLIIAVVMKKTKVLCLFKLKWDKKYILISWLFIVYIVFNFEFTRVSTSKIPLLVLMIISCVSIGLFEEILFRGLILGTLLKNLGSSRKGLFFSVIFSSLLFGLVHFNNYFSGKADLVETLCQVGYATFIGVAFSAILIRCDFSIWWCIVLHALFDIGSDITKVETYKIGSSVSTVSNLSISDNVINMFTMIPLLIYGLFLLRKVNINGENTNCYLNVIIL